MANAAIFGQFKIYPRGFLGSLQSPTLVSKPKTGDALTSRGLATLLDANETPTVMANAAVEEIWAKMVRANVLTTDPDYIDEVCRVVFKAFGTMDFEGWYMAQFQSPSFGGLHRDFLDDTLRYIRTGQRNLSMVAWDALLDTGDKPSTDPKLSEQARIYFGKEYVRDLVPSRRHDLIDVVQRWISHPVGVQDLVSTVHLLFGLKS